jgi:hypothetical protein
MIPTSGQCRSSAVATTSRRRPARPPNTLTATALMPRSRHASATSIAYSMKTARSLYVNATLRQPSRSASAARASGDAACDRVSISRDLEMSQVWQKRPARSHPAVPNDSTEDPAGSG